MANQHANTTNSADNKILHAKLSYQITGVLFKVHNALGRFCNEKQYADALECSFRESGINFKREQELEKSFEAEQAGRNRVDFLIEDEIVLEIKAKRIIERRDYFQMKRYLVAGNKKLGILVNFQQRYLSPKRVLNSEV